MKERKYQVQSNSTRFKIHLPQISQLITSTMPSPFESNQKYHNQFKTDSQSQFEPNTKIKQFEKNKKNHSKIHYKKSRPKSRNY